MMAMADFAEDGQDPEGEAAGAITLLTFELAGQRLAVEVARIREILDLQPVARLPAAPPDVLGVIDVRGEGVAMVDLAGRLGMHRGGGEEARVIVVELAAEPARTVGFEADRVVDVVAVDPEAVEAVPATATAARGWRHPAVTGMTRLGGALFMIVDLQAVLGGDGMEFA